MKADLSYSPFAVQQNGLAKFDVGQRRGRVGYGRVELDPPATLRRLAEAAGNGVNTRLRVAPMELSLCCELETSDLSEAGVKCTFDSVR
jgi:hypothetical protein